MAKYTMNRPLTRAWCVLVVLLTLVGACASDSGDSGQAATVSTPSATATLPTAQNTQPQNPPTSEEAASPAEEPSPTVQLSEETTAAAESVAPATPTSEPIPADELELVAYPVPAGSRPHDVAPAPDGGVWYTAQGSGELGWLDPATGETRHTPLGARSRPHGVIVGPDGAAWVTDSGLNAIVKVDPSTQQITEYPLPAERPDANLNTAAFDQLGRLWFTGQNGIHGVLDPATGTMEVFDSPGGRGPYGIAAAPAGTIYFASLAGSYVGLVAPDGQVTVLEPPTSDQGARRVWADSAGSIWVSEWNSGQLSRYVPDTGTWTSWLLPGPAPKAYAVYVDSTDIVWVSDFGGNAMHRFDPGDEAFTTFELPSDPGDVRQILGRPGEVWGAASAADELIVIRRADS